MTRSTLLSVRSGAAVPRLSIPSLSIGELRDAIIAAKGRRARVSSMFGIKREEETELYVVLADDEEGTLHVGMARVKGGYATLTGECPQVHLFEREIHEQTGLVAQGHPWLKPVRFPSVKGNGKTEVGITDFFRVEGEEIHEVAVGPVHAGVIEPGHFRFQCHGETVFHLEISLGYQHRGVERGLLGGPDKRSLRYLETAAGDTTVGHALAYANIVEALAGCRAPARAEALRAVALELERLANHTGDLGALAGDVGFLPTQSWCGRLRGDFLNLTAVLCGNRFGRSFVRPGGVGFDVDRRQIEELRTRLEAAFHDVAQSVELLWTTPSVQARFEDSGPVSGEDAEKLGLVGLAARACGLLRDVRKTHPTGMYKLVHIPVSTAAGGDVQARAFVRWLEVVRSVEFVRTQLGEMPVGSVRLPVGTPAPDMFSVSLVEGWRGEICHVALTDKEGRFEVYKVVDPSFHNWSGLAMALRNQQISDFPLCNKSFNLSYCGYDL